MASGLDYYTYDDERGRFFFFRVAMVKVAFAGGSCGAMDRAAPREYNERHWGYKTRPMRDAYNQKRPLALILPNIWLPCARGG